MKSFAVALVVAAIGVKHTGALHRIGASSATPFGSFDKTAMLKYLDGKLMNRATGCSREDIHIENPVNASVPGVGEGASDVQKALGYDFRGCYGETVDLLGHPVCGRHVLEVLHTQLEEKEVPHAAMITDIPGFIIKSVSDAESENMKEFLPEYGKVTGRRVYPTCHRTGIAPICGLLEIHVNEGPTHRWIIMRAVQIPTYKGVAPTRVSQHYEKEGVFLGFGAGEAEVKEYDLKGPAFAQVGEAAKLTAPPAKLGKIDVGFHKIFLDGINLDGCGSRAAAAVLGQDTMILRDEGFTDYSLLVKSYDAMEEFPKRDDKPEMTHQSHNKDCVCGSKPVFPLILDGVKKGAGENGEDIKVRFAVGIIDYLETGKANKAMENNPRAEMIAPIPYRVAFMNIFPKYFELPPIKMADWQADFGTEPAKGTLLCALASYEGDCKIEVGNELTFEASAYERAGEEEMKNENLILVDYGKDQSCKVPARVLAPKTVCTYDKAWDVLKRKLKAVLPEEDGLLKEDSLQKRAQHVISKLVAALKTKLAPYDPTMPGAKPLMITFPGFSPMKVIRRIVRRLAN